MQRFLLFYFILFYQPIFCQSSNSIIEEQYETTIADPIFILPVDKAEGDTSNIQFIIRAHNKLYFTDNSFSIVNELNIAPGLRSKLIPSKNNRFLLLEEEFNYPSSRSSPTGERSITLVDYRGHRFYSRKEGISWDEGFKNKRVVSGLNGFIYELDSYASVLYVWNNAGVLIKKYTLFDESTYLNGYIDITSSGNHVVILKNKLGPQWPYSTERVGDSIQVIVSELKSGLPQLFVFNVDGDLVQTKVLEHEDAKEIFINSSRIYCVLFDMKGERIQERFVAYDYNLERLYEIDHRPYFLNDDNNDLILGYIGSNNNSYISKYNSANGEKEWDFLIDHPPPKPTRRERGGTSLTTVHGLAYMNKSRGVLGVHVKQSFGPPGPMSKKYSLILISPSGEEIQRIELGYSPPVFLKDKFSNDFVSASATRNKIIKHKYQSNR